MADFIVGGKVQIDTGNANEEILKLKKQLEDLRKVYQDSAEGSKEQEQALQDLIATEKKLTKSQETLTNSTQATTKEAKKAESGFAKLKTIIGGLGIVNAISAGFEIFKEALMKNKKVADFFGAVMTTISNVMSELITIVSNVVEKISNATNGFEGLGKVMSGILTLAITPFKVAFYEISIAIGYVQLAWEKLFGDDSQKTIDAINERITTAKNGLVETAKNAVGAGKDIVNNFGKAVSEVGQVVSGVVEGASKISIKSIYNQSKAIIELKNNAKIAEAQLAGIVATYQQQAEKLRQLRDDENASIEDRIDANNKLGETLILQQKASLNLADTKIKAAKAELAANKGNVELQAAVINAENERKQILNDITGLQSEQKVNAVGLQNTLLQLNKQIKESDAGLLLDKKRAVAEQINDELTKNIYLQKLRDEERESELKRLQEVIDKTNKGTQARVDAEIAFKEKKQQLDIDDINASRERIKISNALKIEQYEFEKSIIEKSNLDAITKAEKLLEIQRNESAKLIEQLHQKRDDEIALAESQGLDVTAIKQKYANEEQKINADLAAKEIEIAKQKLAAKQALEQEYFKTITAGVDFYRSILDTQSELITQQQSKDADSQKQQLDSQQITKEQYETNIAKINEDAEKKKRKIQRQQIIAEKAVGIGSIILNTLQANAKAVAEFPLTLGQPWVTLNTIQGALGVASTIAQASKALAALGGGGGGGTGGGGSLPSAGGGGGTQAPIQAQLQTTTLNQSQIQQMGNAAVRSFVVESDVSGNQERIRRLNRAARIN